MRVLWMWSVAALVAFGGCHSGTPRQQEMGAAYDRQSGKLRELSYDADKNGRPDMKALMDGNRVRKVEVDENGDGRADRWEYYESALEPASPKPRAKAGARDSGLGPRGSTTSARLSNDPVLVRIERATRHDGRITRTEGFVNGALAWAEEDRDANGRVDRWEKYAGGALSTLALDTRGRGTPNRLLTYTGSSLQIDEK